MTDTALTRRPSTPRPGRPKRADGENRAATFGVRVSDVDLAEIDAQAARAGLSRSDYCRRVVLGHRVAEASTSISDRDRRAALVELNRVGVNLNQIARVMNRGDGVPHDLARTLAEVRALVERLAMESAEVDA